jgi:PAS domain S-box-containing protein
MFCYILNILRLGEVFMENKIVPLTNMIDIKDHGHILYTYDTVSNYIENAISYIETGIEQGHHLMIIESKDLYEQMKIGLSGRLTREEFECIHFIDNYEFYRLYDDFHCDLILSHFSDVIHNLLEKHITVRTWANVCWNDEKEIEAKLENLEKTADQCMRYTNLISVCAYNGNKISASLQNSLLKSHEYFMTDHELVKSYLYKNSSIAIPSLAIQEEQIHLEEKLNASKHQLQSFIFHNLDPVVIIDKWDKVITVNEAYQTTFGYMSNEVIGKNANELPFIPEDRKFEVILNRSFAVLGEKVKGYETIRKTKDGKVLQVQLSSFPLLDEKNKVDGWAVIIRDITERKQAQELLIKSEKLSIAGELAAGIAHEIRNPITSIKGFLQLMQSSNYEKKIYYDIMSSEIDRIEQILSELLMLAKPQAVHFSRKDITVLIRDVVTLLGPQATLNNVQIIMDLKTEAAQVMCEENQIKQVCINFIKNAIDAMPDGGTLIIQLISTMEQELIIRFIDEGNGIPDELISKLGQPFYTTKEKGTGLGFMVSKRIVENHQGSVSISSEVGKGTSIEVKLPY